MFHKIFQFKDKYEETFANKMLLSRSFRQMYTLQTSLGLLKNLLYYNEYYLRSDKDVKIIEIKSLFYSDL